jgi:hypothetical protein
MAQIREVSQKVRRRNIFCVHYILVVVIIRAIFIT